MLSISSQPNNMIAIHDTFEVHPMFKTNYVEFTAVTTTTKDISADILQQILGLTDTELYDHLVSGSADRAKDHWLRYKATVLRKLLALPGDFTFLKYSYKLQTSCWLLNALYAAVDSVDAWAALRTIGDINEKVLMSHTPTMEQLEKMLHAANVTYTKEELFVALRTIIYIAKHGWHHYIWKRAGGLSPLRASVFYY
jgi:hypothetical protein